MRKLLLVMLVPVLVLGVMGCGNKIDAGVQTDEKVQGAWTGSGDASGYVLFISAAQITVKFADKVSTPYRTEFGYQAGTPRFLGEAGAGDAWLGEDPAVTPAEGDIAANITLFKYEDNTEIATIKVVLVGGALTILDVNNADDLYYKADAFPVEGTYSAM
jgi:hypothetical protein